MDAGVEILLHPEMAHAKVLRIDEQVLIGGCNLDDLSLFRNDELDLLFADPAVAELTEHADLRRARRDVHPCQRHDGGAAACLERSHGPRVAVPLTELRPERIMQRPSNRRESEMTVGPVDYIAIAFPGNKFSGRDHPGASSGCRTRARSASSTW